MKIIIDVKTREGKKLTRKERTRAVNILEAITLVIDKKIKGLDEMEGIPYKDGVKFIIIKDEKQ